eukprot:g2235.t1
MVAELRSKLTAHEDNSEIASDTSGDENKNSIALCDGEGEAVDEVKSGVEDEDEDEDGGQDEIRGKGESVGNEHASCHETGINANAKRCVHHKSDGTAAGTSSYLTTQQQVRLERLEFSPVKLVASDAFMLSPHDGKDDTDHNHACNGSVHGSACVQGCHVVDANIRLTLSRPQEHKGPSEGKRGRSKGALGMSGSIVSNFMAPSDEHKQESHALAMRKAVPLPQLAAARRAVAQSCVVLREWLAACDARETRRTHAEDQETMVQLLQYSDNLINLLRPAVHTLEAPSLSPQGGFHFPLLPSPLPSGAFHPLPPPDVVLEYFAEDGGVGVRALLVSLHSPVSMLPEPPPALWPAQTMLTRRVRGLGDEFAIRATFNQNYNGTGDELDVACCVPQATQPAFLEGFGGGSFVHGHEHTTFASALAATGCVSAGGSALSCMLSDAFGSSSPVTRALLHPMKSWSPPADEPSTSREQHKTSPRWRLGRRRPGAGITSKVEAQHTAFPHNATYDHGGGAGHRGALLSQSLVGHVVNFNGQWLKVHQAHVAWTSVPQLSVSLQAMRVALVDLVRLRNAAAAVQTTECSATRVTCQRLKDATRGQGGAEAAVSLGTRNGEHDAMRDAAIAARRTAQREALEAAREKLRERTARDEREERAWVASHAAAPARSEAQPQVAVPARSTAVRAAAQHNSSIFDEFDTASPPQQNTESSAVARAAAQAPSSIFDEFDAAPRPLPKPKPTSTVLNKPPPRPLENSDPFQSSIFDDF